MNKHINDLIEAHPALASCAGEIEAAYEKLRASFADGGKLLLCGNGGSDADADHWAAELLKGFVKKRPLPPEQRKQLSTEVAERLQGALPAIPLTGFAAFQTAFANDVDSTFAFAQLVWALGATGDVLVGISTSGQAENVCAAMNAARAKNLVTVGLTGQSGGRLKELTDVCIRAPASETHRVQELHLPIYHCLCLMLEETFFG